MCNPDGSPKSFQTHIKELAEIKAQREGRRLGKPIYVYFCLFCKCFCITSQKKISQGQKYNSKTRRKKALRPQICDWESEGGSFGE